MIAYSFDHDWLMGVQLGVEFPPVAEIDPDMKFAVSISLFIVRLTFVLWKTGE